MLTNHLLFGKRVFSAVFALEVWILLLSIITILVNRSDTAILKRQANGWSPYNVVLTSVEVFNSDEQRIAKRFATDTLFGLMRKGLIKRYQRFELGTSIAVNGGVWKQRSQFFKQSLLREVSVYNEVNGFDLLTQIVDSESGKLYAQVSRSAKTWIYE
ncbi:MAG TPA: hypothetical protein VMH23_06710 [Bacteroidota bacterium]|nr:hypothetical protein [Bacteroidota bacterium]